jgi:hypothetical protein
MTALISPGQGVERRTELLQKQLDIGSHGGFVGEAAAHRADEWVGLCLGRSRPNVGGVEHDAS